MSVASVWAANRATNEAARPVLTINGEKVATVTFEGNLEFLRAVIKPSEISTVASWVQANFLT